MAQGKRPGRCCFRVSGSGVKASVLPFASVTIESGIAMSALPPDERGWITFAEARSLFSTKDAQYAFGETDRDGRRNVESFAAQHRFVINFVPVEGRVYFVRDPTAVTTIV